jgi:hypothetical protein
MRDLIDMFATYDGRIGLPSLFTRVDCTKLSRDDVDDMILGTVPSATGTPAGPDTDTAYNRFYAALNSTRSWLARHSGGCQRRGLGRWHGRPGDKTYF